MCVFLCTSEFFLWKCMYAFENIQLIWCAQCKTVRVHLVGVKAREMHGKWRKENSRENGKGVCLVGGSEDNCFLPKSTFCEEKFFSPNGSGDKMDLRWEIAYMPLSTLQVVFCLCVCVLCFFFQALNIHFFNYYVNAFFFWV